MSRIEPIYKREQLDAEGQKAFDEIIGSRGQVTGPYTVLMNSPELAALVSRLGKRIRFENTIPRRLQEMAILCTAAIAECDFVWFVNRRHAQADGVDDSVVDAIERGDRSALGDEDRRVYELAYGLLVEHKISDDLFKYWKDALGPLRVTDLIGTIGYYSLLTVVANGFGVDRQTGFPPGTRPQG